MLNERNSDIMPAILSVNDLRQARAMIMIVSADVVGLLRCERRGLHNGIEHRDSSRGYSERAHRPLVAHRAGACAYRDRLCRECVSTRAPQRKSAGCKSPALQLLHCTGRRVVWGLPNRNWRASLFLYCAELASI